MTVYLDRIAHLSRDLGDAELALQRQREEFYVLLVKARLEGEGAAAIAKAAGLSRQRLYQIIDKAKAGA